jgi:hypothetical protein
MLTCRSRTGQKHDLESTQPSFSSSSAAASLSNFELGGREVGSVARSRADSEDSREKKGDDKQRARLAQSEQQESKLDEDTDIVVVYIYIYIYIYIYMSTQI